MLLFSDVLDCRPLVRFEPLTSIVSFPRFSEIYFLVVSSLPPINKRVLQQPIIPSHVFSYLDLKSDNVWTITLSDIPIERTKAITLSKFGICDILQNSSIIHLTWTGSLPPYLKLALLERTSNICVYSMDTIKLKVLSVAGTMMNNAVFSSPIVSR